MADREVHSPHILPERIIDLDRQIKKKAQQAVAVMLWPDKDAILDMLDCLGLQERY